MAKGDHEMGRRSKPRSIEREFEKDVSEYGKVWSVQIWKVPLSEVDTITES